MCLARASSRLEIPPSLAEDIHRLETNERENRADDENADEVNN